jgi:hypothetical protein
MIPVLLGLLILVALYSVLLSSSFIIQIVFPRWFLFEYYSWFGRFIMNPMMLATLLTLFASAIMAIGFTAQYIGLLIIQALS